jgi:signal transduction histidine kinase
VARFALAGLVALAALAGGGVLALRAVGEREAIEDTERLATLAARGIVEPALTDAALAGRPGALARLDQIVQERVLSEDIVRVKIWTPDGRIAYSDEPRLIGRRYTLGEDERASLRDGGVEAEVSDLSEPENVFERDEGSLFEVYLPIRSPSGRLALMELYQRQDALASDRRRLLLAVAPVVGGALLLLWLVQTPLAWSMARRLRSGERERRRLLESAIEASTVERRRIAADLHDGPVQDMAGLAFTLAAAAERAPAEADPALVAALRDGAASAREGTRRLRSAVVDINPGRLHDEGLAAAIADLAAPLAARGLEVQLDVPAGLEVGATAEELLYRAAAEALRNVAAHSGATRVAVRAGVSDGRARLAVEDDGRGFGADERARRRAEGHVGLSLLEDLAGHLGGEVRVRSTPGAGTVVEVEVPA